MINKISFTGKAYFSNDVLKVISPSHKKRIERYAQKKDDNTDVFVTSKQNNLVLELNGSEYPQKKYKFDWDGKDAKYVVLNKDGSKSEVLYSDAKIVKKPVPVYNAVIVDNTPMSHFALHHIKAKEFDFSEDTDSVLIDGDGHVYPDIKY